MKTIVSTLAAIAIGALGIAGCSHLGDTDSRGAGLNQPDVVRNSSSGTIAGSPDVPH